MDIRQIIELILIILCAGGFGVLLYYKVRGNVIAAVGELIALAETTGKSGAEKMAQVVAELANLVPAPFKAILTEGRLKAIAQSMFNWMQKYADEYQKKLETIETEESVKDVTDDYNRSVAAELIAELVSLSLSALKDKAAEYGLVVDSLTTKKAVAEAIINAILNKA